MTVRMPVCTWLIPLLGAALLTGGCERRIEGPTPVVAELANPLDAARRPAQACNAQAAGTGWAVNVLGEGFAPLPINVLSGGGEVVMPTVSLSGPESYEVPSDRVHFVDPTRLRVQLPTGATSPAKALAAGTYAVSVRNHSGTQGQLAAGLQVVPPPTLTSADAAGYSEASETPVSISGAAFRTGDVPGIIIFGGGLPTVTLTSVAVVSETQVTATIPAGTPPGTYTLTLTNPEGCAATLVGALVLSDASLGMLTLDPRFGWHLRNQAVNLYNAPTGTESDFSGGAPEAFIVAPLKTAPGTLVQIPLRRESFVSAGAVSAVIPTCSGMAASPSTDAICADGIEPGGPYEIRVRDPNGASGTVPVAAGFFVLTEEPPEIMAISPSAISTQGLSSANPLVITGEQFGAAAQPQVVSLLASGNLLACDLPIVSQTGTTEVRAEVPMSIAAASCTEYDAAGEALAASSSFSLSEGQYLVRIQRTTDIAFADFAALVVRNPSADPEPAAAIGTRLSGPRADFSLVRASDDSGRHFLYAIGGTDGVEDLSTVELGPISAFGDVGGDCSVEPCRFRVLDRTPMMRTVDLGSGPERVVAGRRGHGAVAYTVQGDTGYLYVFGGQSGAETLASVERAQVLRGQDAPELGEPTPTTGGTLEAGTFYYQVSAIRDEFDPVNPFGETLPSEVQPVTLGSDTGQVSLQWTCSPGAASYRIYRTAEANARSGEAVFLEEVMATASCSGTTLPEETYADDGSLLPAGDRPLPPGALGTWVAQAPLNVHRAGGAAQRIGTEVYVVAGYCALTGGGCPSDDADLGSIERASIDPSTGELGAFAEVATLTTPRRRFQVALANADSAPAHFSSTAPIDVTRDAWLIVGGGADAGGALTGTTFGVDLFEAALVTDDGAPVAAPAFTGVNYGGLNSAYGGWARVVANQLVVTAATAQGTFTSKANAVCVGQCAAAASLTGTLNNTKITAYESGAGLRFLNGAELFRAYIYVGGGFATTAANSTPSETLERFTY